jgi:hypothetical protein
MAQLRHCLSHLYTSLCFSAKYHQVHYFVYYNQCLCGHELFFYFLNVFFSAISIEGPQFVDKGKKLVLTCNATGQMFPPEDIDWFKDGQKIKESERKGISIAKFRIAKTKMLHSQMEIDKADMSDKGIYICRSSDLAITSTNVIVLNGE